MELFYGTVTKTQICELNKTNLVRKQSNKGHWNDKTSKITLSSLGALLQSLINTKTTSITHVISNLRSKLKGHVPSFLGSSVDYKSYFTMYWQYSTLRSVHRDKRKYTFLRIKASWIKLKQTGTFFTDTFPKKKKKSMWAVKPLMKQRWERSRQFSSRRGEGPIHQLNFSQFEELYSPPGRLFKRERSSFRTWVTLASFRLYSCKCPQQRQNEIKIISL